MIEHATGGERSYPPEWGTPVGAAFSDERTDWIRDQIERRRPTSTTTTSSTTSTSPARALASLQARRHGPLTGPEARLKLAEKKRRTVEQDERLTELFAHGACP